MKMVDNSEWKTVSYKHNRSKNGGKNVSDSKLFSKAREASQRKAKSLQNESSIHFGNDSLSDEAIFSNISQAIEIISSTPLLQQLLALLNSRSEIPIDPIDGKKEIEENINKPITRIVALGIGSVSTSTSAQWQWALLVLLNEVMKVKSCFCYDPLFSDVERRLCTKYNFECLNPKDSSDSERLGLNKRFSLLEKDDVVLFYMPHCPYRLYCNILWSRIYLLPSTASDALASSAESRTSDLKSYERSLQNTVIIGNSFNSYAMRRFALEKSSCDLVETLGQLFTETPLRYDSLGAVHSQSSYARLFRSQLEASFCDLSFMEVSATLVHSSLGKLSESVPTLTEMLEASRKDVELI